MIVGILERESNIIAVNHWGELLMWNIAPKVEGKPVNFEHNVSLVGVKLRTWIDEK